MISVKAALDKMLKVIRKGSIISLKLTEAAGYVIAENVKSHSDVPPFNQSAMDGYAFRFTDLKKFSSLKIAGESRAGKNFIGKISIGEAVRIFTGASVPEDADTVVMQEKTRTASGNVTITDDRLKKGANIRIKGSHFKKGKIAVEKNTVANTGTIGFLAALGAKDILVYGKPSVTVIITGEELVAAGKKLLPGQIYESNGATLSAALSDDGISKIKIAVVKDKPGIIRKQFRKAAEQSDFVIFSGGISVGDYDFVGPVLKEEKVKTIFYKVLQKPGKPLFFGVKNKCYIFGLPGNPASVLTCYYEYVRPALKKFSGYPQPFPRTLILPVTADLVKKPGLTHFLKAVTDFHTVTPLAGQESYIMTPFVKANCFIVLPEETEFVKQGADVTVHLI